jgi:hypothetical protein
VFCWEAPGIELAVEFKEKTWSFAPFAHLAGSIRPSIEC